VSTTSGNTGNLLEFEKSSGNTGNLLEFEKSSGNTGNLLEFYFFLWKFCG
jgi:hypothetical protein